jgi:hypothetical protein
LYLNHSLCFEKSQSSQEETHAFGLYSLSVCALSVEQDAFATLNEGECRHEKLDAAEDSSNLGGPFDFLLVEHTTLLPLNLVCGVFCH